MAISFALEFLFRLAIGRVLGSILFGAGQLGYGTYATSRSITIFGTGSFIEAQPLIKIEKITADADIIFICVTLS